MTLQLNEREIQSIVQNVVERLRQKSDPPISRRSEKPHRSQLGVFDTLEAAIPAAEQAQRSLLSMTLAQRNKMIASMRSLLHEYTEELSKLAVDETKLGRVDDKIKKNRLVID